MATNLRKLYQNYINMTEEQRIANAKKEIVVINQYLKNRGFNNNDILGFEVSLFRLYVSANHKASESEHRIFNAIFGLETTFERFFEVCDKGASEEFVEDMNEVIDTWPSDAKLACVGLGLCVMSNNGQLDSSETKLLERILAE